MAFFGLGKKKSEAGCCGKGCPSAPVAQTGETNKSAGIKVLGGGCAKCHELQANTRTALARLGLDEEVQLITDFAIITTYGVMSTPALVVDEKVVGYGKVLKPDEICTILKRERGL